MKKYLLTCLALVALFSCKKETPTPSKGVITLSTLAAVTLSNEEGTSQIQFKSTAAWTAAIDDAAKSFAAISPKSGEAAQTATVTVTVSENTGEAARSFNVTLTPDGGDAVKVTFTQAAKEAAPFFEVTKPEVEVTQVPKEGGKFDIVINTNTEFSYTDYHDSSFPWQTLIPGNDGKSFKLQIDANTGYEPRPSYVKFTVPAIQDPVLDGNGDPVPGELVDHTVRVYFNQAGLPCNTYSISMYDAEFDTWGTTVLSEAIFNGKHYVSNGQDLYEINPANGAYSKIDWPWDKDNKMTQKVITTDDAGNLIICNHTAYIDEAYTDGNFILNVVTPAGQETNLITKAAWECGGPFGARIRVTGDITSNALICAPVEGIVDVTGSNNIGCWEVEGGTLGEYVKIPVTGPEYVSWSKGTWVAYPTWCPTFIAKGTTFSEGFVMSGCYDENVVYAVAVDMTDSTATGYKMLESAVYEGDTDGASNYGFQSMSMAVIGTKPYLAVLASPFFPDYGVGWFGAPFLFILEIPDQLPAEPLNIWNCANLHYKCTSYFPVTDPATDWGIGVHADIKLFDAKGKIGVAMTDLNGRSIESYVFDPAVITPVVK